MCLDKSSWLTPAEGVNTTILQDHFSSPRQVKMFGLRLNEASWLPLSRTGSEYILFTTMSETYGKHFFLPLAPTSHDSWPISVSSETINWGLQCVYACKMYMDREREREYVKLQDPVLFRWLMDGNAEWHVKTRIIQRALKASVSLQSVEVEHYLEEERLLPWTGFI